MARFYTICCGSSLAITLCLLVLLLPSTGLSQLGPKDFATVRAGVLSDWPPQYRLNELGRPTGFAIDVIEQVAVAANLVVTYTVLDSWEQAFDALRNGDIDLIPNQGITEERRQWFAFTSPVETFPIVIFIRRATLDITGEQDLAGHVVAAVQANVGRHLMKQRSDVDLRIYTTLKDAFFELLAGRVDALIYPKPVLLKLAMDVGLDDHIKVVGRPLLEVKRAISVRKDNGALLSRLEGALQAFIESKAYGQIYSKWYGRPKPYWDPKRMAMMMSVIIMMTMILGAVWYYFRTTSINRRLRQSIHDQARAEEALRASEEKYRMMVEYQHDLLVKLDADGRIIFTSPSIQDLFGCTEQEIVGTNLLSLVHPHDYEDVKLAMQSLWVAPHLCRYEVRCMTSDGWKWFSWSNRAVMDDQSQLREIIALGRDTTKRKAAEERIKDSEEKFRAIFEHAADSVLLLDSNTFELVDFNTTAHQTLGYSRDEFKAMDLKNLLVVEPPETRIQLARRILKSLNQPVEAMLRTKTGQLRYYRVKQQPINLNRGKYLLGIWHDITDRRLLEEHLVQSQKMEAIGTLAGGVAHDFNNILSIIIGNTELATQDMAKDHPLFRQLSEINTAGLRAKDVVAQLLSFSRQDEITCSPVSLKSIVEECMQLLRVSIPASIDFEKHICSQPLTVMADATQIQQVLINLCTNSAHAMEAKGGLLTVALDAVDLDQTHAGQLGIGSGAYAHIAVEDTGTGIDQAIIDRIFEPYFTTKQANLGTGMGLAIVHGIVTKFGGAISVDSQQGRGTCFHVLIPVTSDAVAAKAKEQDEILTGCGRVLLVDDEPSLLAMCSQYLMQLGYEVHTADNARYALDLFRSQPDTYDLIVTDMTMPKVSGDVLVKEIFNINPRIPVIMCSGYHNEALRRNLRSLGINTVLQKPVPMRTLAISIKQALADSSQACNENAGDRHLETGSIKSTP